MLRNPTCDRVKQADFDAKALQPSCLLRVPEASQTHLYGKWVQPQALLIDDVIFIYLFIFLQSCSRDLTHDFIVRIPVMKLDGAVR